MHATVSPSWSNSRGSARVFLQATLVPLISIAPIAVILIWGLGLGPSSHLTRGILYGCLFVACAAVGRWKFTLEGTGISSKNIGRGFLYASIVLVVAFAFVFALQPPKGLADIGLPIWSPVLFYLTVSLAEETWFRGLIFKALYDWRGPLLAVLGSAMLFGLMHVPAHGLAGLLFSLSMGLPYAVVRLATNNILGLIAAHWLTNLIDSFIDLSTTSFALMWLTLLHFVVFGSLSILLLLLDRRLRGQQDISP